MSLFEVIAQEVGRTGQVRWTVKADSPLAAVAGVLDLADTVSGGPSLQERHRQLGQDLLEIATLGGMPDSYFMQDERIKRAAAAMGMSVQQAFEWMDHL